MTAALTIALVLSPWIGMAFLGHIAIRREAALVAAHKPLRIVAQRRLPAPEPQSVLLLAA